MAQRHGAAPVARRIPSERTHHGDTFVDEYAWLADKDNPDDHRLPGGRERLYRGGDRRPGRAARGDLRRDQGPDPGDRPVGADPQGRLVVLRADRGGQAVRDAVPPRGPARRRRAADDRGRHRARRRGGAARRERAGRRRRVLLAGRVRDQPGRQAARVLDRLRGRRALHPAVQGPGHRGRCCPTRYPTPITASPGRSTARRCSTSRWTRPGGRTGCGGTSSAPRRRTTWSCSRRRTSGSGSASG